MERRDKKHFINKLDEWLIILFPDQEIYQNEYSLFTQIGIFVLFTGIFSIGGYFFPADGFIGFDWIHFFEQVKLPVFYPPWTDFFVSFLSWHTLIGLTLGSVSLAIIKRSTHLISGIAAFFSLPLFWTLFLGQIDGLALLGILGLPWLAPLALIKPQVTIFAFLARRSFIIALIGILLVSVVIWGLWFQDMFSVWMIHEEGKYVNDIALGLWGIPISVILLWFSRGDIDMLMAAGVFATPYLLPYNLIPLIPAISRLNPSAAIFASFISWLPLLANWVEGGWYFGWIFILWIWYQLARDRYPDSKIINYTNRKD